MASTAAQRRSLGAYGETVAARLLQAGGMVLLERNWRCAEGELDLILRDGADLVACEVKTRRGMWCGTPHQAITGAKLARLGRLITRWAAEREVRPGGIRIDLVAVLVTGRGAPQVDHVRGLI